MDNECSDSTRQSKLDLSNLKLVNAQGAPILVEGLILEHAGEHDILLETLSLDLTDNFEQAILTITASLAEGKILTLYPAELSDFYSPMIEGDK